MKTNHTPCWELCRLPVTFTKIDEVTKEWSAASSRSILPYGLYVPVSAKFQTREILLGSNLVYDILSLWHEEYLIVNNIAFALLQPFAQKEFRMLGRPLMIY